MQLRTQTLVGEWEFIRSSDPAWDRPVPPERGEDEEDAAWNRRVDAWKAAMQVFADAYQHALETGDFAKVPLKAGAKPAIWRFRHLSAQQRAWLRDQSGTEKGVHELSLDAAALALVGVAGHPGPGGAPLDVQRKKDPTRRGWMAVVEEQLVGLDQAGVVLELGNQVVATLLPRNG
jgi:hypothetical protein